MMRKYELYCMTYHDAALKVKLRFEEMVLRVSVVAGMRAVDVIVRAPNPIHVKKILESF